MSDHPFSHPLQTEIRNPFFLLGRFVRQVIPNEIPST